MSYVTNKYEDASIVHVKFWSYSYFVGIDSIQFVTRIRCSTIRQTGWRRHKVTNQLILLSPGSTNQACQDGKRCHWVVHK